MLRWDEPKIREVGANAAHARGLVKSSRNVRAVCALNKNGDTCFMSVSKSEAIKRIDGAFDDAGRRPDLYGPPQIERDLDGGFCWIGLS